jgi:transcription initiation factor IIE alpha subunit
MFFIKIDKKVFTFKIILIFYNNNQKISLRNEMTDQKIQIKVLKALLKAELTKSELKLTTHLLTKHDKTITAKSTELSTETGMATPNIIRTLKALESKNVIGYRKQTENIFVKSISQWGVKKSIE